MLNASLVFAIKMERVKYFVILFFVMCSGTLSRSVKKDGNFSRKYNFKDELNSHSNFTVKRTERQADNGMFESSCRVRRCNQVRFM